MNQRRNKSGDKKKDPGKPNEKKRTGDAPQKVRRAAPPPVEILRTRSSEAAPISPAPFPKKAPAASKVARSLEPESEKVPPTARAAAPSAPPKGETTAPPIAEVVAPPLPNSEASKPSVVLKEEPDLPPPSSRLPPQPQPSGREIRAQIKSLEQEIDRELERASSPRLPDDMPMPTPSSALLTEAEGVFATARELLSTDYYLRRWGRLAMRNRSEEVDDFGFDPVYEAKLRSLFDFLYQRYFRVEASGLEHIPDQGRCLLVANHSGTLPADGLMIKLAVKREHPHPRDVRWLAEDFLFHLPFLGSISNRIGAVRACQENAERLLRQDALVAVFPEGVKGIGKLYKDRYHLQRFGRGGFIKLAIRTRTPIVPVGVVGGEETNPLLYRLEGLGKAFGLPYFPITPTFPLLGPAGLLPLPTKWRVVFGPRLEFADYDPDDAEDEVLVSRLADRVRSSIQDLVDGALGTRSSIWFG